MTIVVIRLLFWLTIFRSEDRTRDNTLGSLGNFTWYQSRSIHRTKQVKWLYVIITQWFLEYPEHWWKNGVWGLYPDTTITPSLGRYQEHSVSQSGVDSNDFTDHVVTRKDRSYLVIGVRDNISRVHVVEHDLIRLIWTGQSWKGWFDSEICTDWSLRRCCWWMSLV